MYKKNLKSVIHLNLNILLTVFLNRAIILLLTFFFSLNLEKKLSSLLSLTSALKTSYFFSFSL